MRTIKFGIILLLLAVLFTAGCSKTEFGEIDKNTIHLPLIPTEITFSGQMYNVRPEEINEGSVGNEIGKVGIFRVFEIKGVKPEDEIALLVRDRDPIVYYGAHKK